MKGFRLRVKPLGLLTVGWSHPAALGADVPYARLYVRRRDGSVGPLYYIPASSLKGALRSAASRVAESYGFSSCGQTKAALIELAHGGSGNSSQPCDVCGLFGGPGRTQVPQLFFEDFIPEDAGERDRPTIVTRVRIGDQDRKAIKGGLYTVEALSKVVFAGSVYYTEGVKRLLPLLLLGIGALRLDRIGRRSAVDIKLEVTEGLRGDLPEEWHGLLGGLENWLWSGGSSK